MKKKGNFFQNRNTQDNINFIYGKTPIKNDILYALISIYYYEKELSLNIKKELIFYDSKMYYFIDPNWIINFKKSYNYQMLSQNLKDINTPITYKNFENKISSIKDYLSQCDFSLENVEITDNLLVNISASQRKYNNLVYYPYCYIIDFRIMKIIKNNVFGGNKLNIYEHKVFAKNSSIYLNVSNNIIYGNLNRNFIFIADYILFFSSSEFYDNEKFLLLQYSFYDYLKYKHIGKIGSNILPLKDENNDIIGKIMLAPKNQITNKSVDKISASKKKFIEFKSNVNLSQTKSNIVFNNSKVKISMNANKKKYKKSNTSKGIESSISPQNIENCRKFNNNQSLSNQPEDINISSNNLYQAQGNIEFARNDKISKLINKDNNSINEEEVEEEDLTKYIEDYNKIRNNFLKMNLPQNKKGGNQLKNNTKIKEDFDLNQQYKERDFQNLLKEINELQNQIQNIKNTYANKISNLEKDLQIKNNENDDLKEEINKLKQIINSQKKEKFNKNQYEFINKEMELNKREEELNEREKNLKERENLISYKKKELNKSDDDNEIEREDSMNEKEKLRANIEKEKELKKQEDELNERQNKLDERETLINKREDEINKKEKDLNEIKEQLNEKENKLNEREDIISQKEMFNKKNELNKSNNYKLIQKENKLNERENLITKKEKEINNKQNKLNEKDDELNEKENELNDRQNKIIIKEKELLKKEKEFKEREIELSKKEKNLNELLESNSKKDYLNERTNIILNKEKKFNKKPIDGSTIIPITPPEKNPISFYIRPTLIGLNNIGATCFMNSTLQCLSQTTDLTNYFLKDSKKRRIINNNLAQENQNSLQLSPIYLKLIKKLWDKRGAKSFSPIEFMNTIEKMNPLFKKGQAGDSKDFIIYILEQIHKELKKKINQNYSVAQPLNQYDRNNALQYFLSDFSNDCSIISDSFFGFTETTNECLNCKNYYNNQYLNNPICYNFGIFNCLIFPLEEVKNYKNKNLMQSFFNMNYMNNMNKMSFMSNISQNNSVTLDDCFLYNQKTDLFTGENRNYCNVCKQLYDSYYTCKIYSFPNNLIIILNRGKNNIYNIKLYFNETIDITQYAVINDGNKWIYNLYGIITHIGESGPNAHFVASCKSPVDNNWYRYNDAIVSPINDFQKEVINFGTPYILFYQKENKNK